MPRDAACYVTRLADQQLFDSLLAMEYCYVLDSRQKGKSSLVNRVGHRLIEAGKNVVQVDLQRLGANLDSDQWYAGISHQVAKALDIVGPFSQFWSAEKNTGACARWLKFLEEVALPSAHGSLIIVVDEIDFVLALPFKTDEFFAGIRGLANARATDPLVRNIAFSLVGSSTPSQLIQEPLITPFNIGRSIELLDFTREELKPLETWLPGGSVALDRVYHWTSGHPYFTQLLCSMMPRTATDVDAAVETYLCSERARRTEPNLLDSERRILETKLPEMDMETSKASLLNAYLDILNGKPKLDDETNSLYPLLMLAGVVVHAGPRLVVRNRIYRTNFDAKWCARNMPDSESRRIAAAARRSLLFAAVLGSLILLAFGGLAGVALHQAVAKGQALSILKARTQVYNKLAYNSGMLLASRDAAEGNWVRVRKLVDRLANSSERGWECDYLSALIQPGEFVRQVPSPIGSIRFFRDGRPFTLGEVWQQHTETGTFFARYEMIPNYELNDLGEARRYLSGNSRLFGPPEAIAFVGLGATKYAWSIDNQSFWVAMPDGKKKLLFTMPGHLLARNVAVGARAERLYVTDLSSTLFCIDAKTNQVVWQRPVSTMNSLAISLDGENLVGAERPGSVLIIRASTGEVIRRLDGHKGLISSCEYSADGASVISAGDDGTVRIWDWQAGIESACISGVTTGYAYARFARNNSVVTLDRDGNLRSVTLPVHALRRTLKVGDRGAIALAVSGDSSRLAVACLGGEFSIVDRRTWKVVGSVMLHATTVNHGLAFSPDGKLVFVADVGKVRVFQALDGLELTSFPGPDKEIRRIVVSPDGKQIGGVGEPTEAWIWEVENRSVRGTLAAGTDVVRSLAFSPDGEGISTANHDGQLKCWSRADLRLLSTRRFEGEHALSCIYTKDSQSVIVTTSTGRIAVVSPATSAPPRYLAPHFHRSYQCVLSSDGSKVLEYGSDGMARILDVASGKEKGTMRCDDYVSEAVWFDRDRRIVTVSGDQSVRVWDAETGDELLRLEGHQGDALCVSIADGGDTITTSGLDGVVQEWSRKELVHGSIVRSK